MPAIDTASAAILQGTVPVFVCLPGGQSPWHNACGWWQDLTATCACNPDDSSIDVRKLCLAHPGRDRADSVADRDLVFKVRRQDVLRRLHGGRAGRHLVQVRRRACLRRCASVRGSCRRRTWPARSGWRSNAGTRSTIASSNRCSTPPTRSSNAETDSQSAGGTGTRIRRPPPPDAERRRRQAETGSCGERLKPL